MKTPLTDSAAYGLYTGTPFREGPQTEPQIVDAQFARQLELENAELRGKLEGLAHFWTAKAGHTSFAPARDRCLKQCARELRAILNEGSK